MRINKKNISGLIQYAIAISDFGLTTKPHIIGYVPVRFSSIDNVAEYLRNKANKNRKWVFHFQEYCFYFVEQIVVTVGRNGDSVELKSEPKVISPRIFYKPLVLTGQSLEEYKSKFINNSIDTDKLYLSQNGLPIEVTDDILIDEELYT